MTTEQVAYRLGVKPSTVYAYVSRGILTSRRNAAGKGSLFAKSDVDDLIASRKRATPNIQTGITLIRNGELFYRGHDVTALARTEPYEAVANLLWDGDLRFERFAINRDLSLLAHRIGKLLPPTARLADRLRVTVAAIATADPLRFDTSPTAVANTARTLIATMVDALPSRAGLRPLQPDSLAESLWYHLTEHPLTDDGRRTLNGALVLLADHDIAASTLAARVAASTRADPYAVISAGLAALDGPLHGAASEQVHPLLAEALTGTDPIGIISERLRTSGGLPGFGHPLYPSGDPRAAALFDLLGDHPVSDAATRLAAAVRTRSGIVPNIDLALATLTLRYDMPPDAGEAIFAVARTAGWLAHALEEYANRPARFRPTGQYSGRPPA
ncbi:citrate synthase [Actinoplanes ianthinogenes]|uniref:citrate synthase (unknown stereospecificity) n=2 Tax=Actinoplanes ianthinogenes TaxID=122358 RepID=A0ABN6CMX1_9ACTN|nr:citrate/2-methylcitrate synthase [Actinoplanes ianthinogenes]BCJ46483.1 citrate synthase [Actinoplanes ianthinogenes]GGR34561.1 citrate synthase [Actinoplanes ianthinogenes]